MMDFLDHSGSRNTPLIIELSTGLLFLHVAARILRHFYIGSLRDIFASNRIRPLFPGAFITDHCLSTVHLVELDSVIINGFCLTINER